MLKLPIASSLHKLEVRLRLRARRCKQHATAGIIMMCDRCWHVASTAAMCRVGHCIFELCMQAGARLASLHPAQLPRQERQHGRLQLQHPTAPVGPLPARPMHRRLRHQATHGVHACMCRLARHASLHANDTQACLQTTCMTPGTGDRSWLQGSMLWTRLKQTLECTWSA